MSEMGISDGDDDWISHDSAADDVRDVLHDARAVRAWVRYYVRLGSETGDLGVMRCGLWSWVTLPIEGAR